MNIAILTDKDITETGAIPITGSDAARLRVGFCRHPKV